MSLFSRKPSDAEVKLDRLIALMEESVGLFREYVAHTTGSSPSTRKAGQPIKQSTEKDLSVMTRKKRLEMQDKAAEEAYRESIHGSGLASETTSTPNG